MSPLKSARKRGKSVLKRSFLFVVSQNSVCVTTKLAQITVERENGCLGKNDDDEEIK